MVLIIPYRIFEDITIFKHKCTITKHYLFIFTFFVEMICSM